MLFLSLSSCRLLKVSIRPIRRVMRKNINILSPNRAKLVVDMANTKSIPDDITQHIAKNKNTALIKLTRTVFKNLRRPSMVNPFLRYVSTLQLARLKVQVNAS